MRSTSVIYSPSAFPLIFQVKCHGTTCTKEFPPWRWGCETLLHRIMSAVWTQSRPFFVSWHQAVPPKWGVSSLSCSHAPPSHTNGYHVTHTDTDTQTHTDTHRHTLSLTRRKTVSLSSAVNGGCKSGFHRRENFHGYQMWCRERERLIQSTVLWFSTSRVAILTQASVVTQLVLLHARLSQDNKTL